MTSKPFLSPTGCDLSATLLDRVSRLRTALGQIERTLQEKHLQCCVFPQIAGAKEIAEAIPQLSAKRIGALIAVEQSMDLSDYAKTGVLINADLNATLLISLFYPGSPLHDGAVIIRGRKIVAGGCILPLSADHESFKAKGLGTRHRAAVGLSLVSDAVIFIVSEESGTMRVASAGKMFHEQGLSLRSGFQEIAGRPINCSEEHVSKLCHL
jgi:diadenylate cyclase